VRLRHVFQTQSQQGLVIGDWALGLPRLSRASRVPIMRPLKPHFECLAQPVQHFAERINQHDSVVEKLADLKAHIREIHADLPYDEIFERVDWRHAPRSGKAYAEAKIWDL
jgi:hypothetical protein